MLNTKLTSNLLRTTDKYIKSLEKGGVLTVGDLISQYPRDFDDRTEVLESFSLINLKEKNTILVKFVSISTTRTANNKLLTKAIFEDKDGFMAEAVWFNNKFLAGSLEKLKGRQVILSGKVKYNYGKIEFLTPDVDGDLSKLKGEILPIYSDVNYIPGKWIGSKMLLLKKFFTGIEETLPEEIIKKYNFISKQEALLNLHFPPNKNALEIAKTRLAYDELFEIQYTGIAKKYEILKDSQNFSTSLPLNPDFVKELLGKLPFSLTDKQKIVLFQILKDMGEDHAMNRLLEGDVGTGKTIVALVSAIHAIKESEKTGDKIQVAIMAPTAILASQHFSGIQDLLLEYNLTSDLLVGATTAKNKKIIKNNLFNGQIDVIVGTHALIEDDVEFNNLGYVIIDEQHRFGVKQRQALEKKIRRKTSKDNTGTYPHVLNMTATPIPRTLALTLYGDQDLSVIDEYPKGRKEIHTKVIKTDEQREQINLFIRDQLEKGRQVFWISPLVEASEKIDLANAIETFESLVDIFSPYTVGLVHGKMKPKEKDEVMEKFAKNEIQVLSSTSVVEVGINVPNATIMCIEGADRFGLSQLHQFRGRVGRGEHQSYCYLFPNSGNTTERLRAMENSNNGFELSEIDLELRGPGEVYGVRQSGVPDLRLADLKDLAMVSQIREDITDLLNPKK